MGKPEILHGLSLNDKVTVKLDGRPQLIRLYRDCRAGVKMMSAAPSQQVGPKWRSVAAAIGLGAAVADALLYVGLAAYAIRIGGFGTNFRPVLFWWRIGVWLGVLAIVASGLGKGRLRKWGLIVGVVTFLVWQFPGHS